MFSPRIAFAVVLLLALTLPAAAAGQTRTAFFTGEQTTGMTKQCFYEALGSTYTRTTSSISLCPLSIQVPTRLMRPTAPVVPAAPRPTVPTTEPPLITAFFTGEQTTGMTKQCFYEALGSAYTKTVSSIAICPVTIQVRRR